MTKEELDALGDADIQDLLVRLQDEVRERREAQELIAREASVSAHDAIATLTALLGPDTGAPSQSSINGMLRYSDADLKINAGLAIRLVLTGMRQLTLTMRDLAVLESRR